MTTGGTRAAGVAGLPRLTAKRRSASLLLQLAVLLPSQHECLLVVLTDVQPHQNALSLHIWHNVVARCCLVVTELS
jgi:hypothetical protein